MQPVESMAKTLQRKYPSAKVELDAPTQSNGVWFLDLIFNGKRLCVEWRPTRGFGLSLNPVNSVYGDGPNEVYPSNEMSKVLARIDELINKK